MMLPFFIQNLVHWQDRSRLRANIQQRKQARRQRRRWVSRTKDAVSIALGILSAGFGLRGFLLPNGLVDGGVMGISLLANVQTGIALSFLILAINLPFLLLAWKQIGKNFSIKSIAAIAVLALVVAVVPYPTVTHDRLLVAAFGGFFLGMGIGLTIRGGAVIDGTEVLAIYLSRKSALTVGDFVLVFNVLIFGVAAYLLTVETALYSILTYLAASKTIDFVLEGIEEYTGVTIISNHSRQISEMIMKKLGRGLTIYTGRKGFGRSGASNQQVDIIFTVVTRLEVSRLTNEIALLDPKAFIVMQSIRDTKGGMVKKLPLKER